MGKTSVKDDAFECYLTLKCNSNLYTPRWWYSVVVVRKVNLTTKGGNKNDVIFLLLIKY